MRCHHSLLLVPVLLLSACSGGDPSTVDVPSPTPTPTASPSASPSPSPTPAPVVTTPAPTSSPSSAVRPKALDGDVDGDGNPDAVKATSELLTVTLSGSGKKVTAPVHMDSPEQPEVLGSTDVDLDGRAEVFLKTVQGASTGFATPYRFDGTALHELQLDGSPALLGFGGSTQHGDGFRCAGGRIEVHKAEADASGTTYTVTKTVYRLTATDLVRVSTRTTKAKQGSAEVDAAYALDCGSVGEGG